MSKRRAESIADHESVPPGAVSFFVPNTAKRLRAARTAKGAPAWEHQPPSPRGPGDEMLTEDVSGDYSDVYSDVDHDLAVSAHHLAGAPCLRAPQHTPLSALGILSPPGDPDAQLFLEQLVSCMQAHVTRCQVLGHTSAAFSSQQSAAYIGTPFWHAVAELNVLLSRHFTALPTSMLRGYHSFTRAPRAQLWGRLAASTKYFWPEHFMAFLDANRLLGLATGVERREAKLIFAWSQALVTDELRRRQRAVSLVLFDFIEAVARLADLISPPSHEDILAYYAAVGTEPPEQERLVYEYYKAVGGLPAKPASKPAC
ncbi:hypothetical protein TSOC_010138 [Tetrabaena socialis]|uniref:Uncharacterized protein n=1 Tax=Tetrabaena socialis TaxID=47790 RepID=A0A2J7ZU18_9CHLO|nr:hypothetical protein TSOC_010138 [Tetrabaena socialis]|eukprot:PNH03764.1 hypothetical protein TSOC_010138 [Tetrabaena socialis]